MRMYYIKGITFVIIKNNRNNYPIHQEFSGCMGGTTIFYKIIIIKIL